MSQFAITIRRPDGTEFTAEASGPCTAVELAEAFRKHKVNVVSVVDAGTGDRWPPPAPAAVPAAKPKAVTVKPAAQLTTPRPKEVVLWEKQPDPWWCRLTLWVLSLCWGLLKWCVRTAFTVPEVCRESHPSNRRGKARGHRRRRLW